MSEKILVPVLGESITEATVAKWLKNKGEEVKSDEALVELETEKVNLEVPSPVDGILSEVNAKNGQTVQVGSVLGIINEGEIKKSKEKVLKIPPQKKQKIENIEKVSEENNPQLFNDNVIKLTKSINSNQDDAEPLVLSKEVKNKTETNKNLSPAVRKIVEENKIDIEKIDGSGKDGRILKGDLINLMDKSPKPSERKIKYGPEERI